MTIEEYSAEIIMLILSMTFTGSIISCFLFTLPALLYTSHHGFHQSLHLP